jgi:hypothetical protein
MSTSGSPVAQSPMTGVQEDGGRAPRPPCTVEVNGRSLLVPRTTFSRAVMGNPPTAQASTYTNQNNQRPLSNLSLLMRQQEIADTSTAANTPFSPPPPVTTTRPDNDSGQTSDSSRKGPPPRQQHHNLGSSAPMNFTAPLTVSSAVTAEAAPTMPPLLQRMASTGTIPGMKTRRYEKIGPCLCCVPFLWSLCHWQFFFEFGIVFHTLLYSCTQMSFE